MSKLFLEEAEINPLHVASTAFNEFLGKWSK